ncbi:hypothetical protein CTAYLR_007787 [Chrysophaeum taylorii]|uniref:VOC domain-containing protein n=1 Tax=Chrysophaeum taylorii TaxID=2483200 RepID=A0AAD7UKU1_9STRA|nr:hypothetical protein CTAYLR_007787 [Chrysophaeum taylorii]
MSNFCPSDIPPQGLDPVIRWCMLKTAPPRLALGAPLRMDAPPGAVSHITLGVSNAARSAKWYERLGLSRVAEDRGVVVMALPEMDEQYDPLAMMCAGLVWDETLPPWQPLVVLKETAERGYNRLCVVVADVPHEVERLAAAGIVASTTKGESSVASFEDPDGCAVELVAGPEAECGWLLVGVNVRDVATSLAAYMALGFVKVVDERVVLRRTKVRSSVIVKPPNGGFWLELVPSSTPPKHAVSLVVDDLATTVDRLCESENMDPELRRDVLPGRAVDRVAAAFRDPDGGIVELVATQGRARGKDKLVVVTGCDSGFGRMLAISAAVEGFEIVAACYSAAGKRRLVRLAQKTVVADLTTNDGCLEVVAAAKEVVEGLSLSLWALVNNAGACLPGNVEWSPPHDFEHSMALNFMAPVTITYELLPVLKETSGSRVVNVSSTAGFIAMPTLAAYSASKHALEAYSDAFRAEMLPWGLKVVLIEPALMRTPLAMSMAKSWLASFSAASEDRRALYGDKWVDRVAAALEATLDVAADPSETITVLMQALTLPDPPPRMIAGDASALLSLKQKPDAERDAALYEWLFPGDPPAAIVAPREQQP